MSILAAPAEAVELTAVLVTTPADLVIPFLY
jgi:hypothetical protein